MKTMADQPAEPNARAALRAATRGIHERLHVAPPFVALARRQLTRRQYAALLSKMAGYYLSVSRHLPLEASRLGLLKADLATVEAPPFQPLDFPVPTGGGQALGWRYVVEGSIFGGRVIHRQLDYLFGDEDDGRSFFRGTATGTRHWQLLCAELEDASTAPAIEPMIEGALDAFAAFEKAISAVSE